ncbi:MAG: RNA 2',3'-cyclic phosphodiesterase [Actinobacteria bacterium]|nr:RNA 2',3'-cyclic phosphodiesterase [Actinomycetota bacterium]
MRLFVAAWPPDEVMRSLAALDRPEIPGLRWTTPDQWHVTLRFFGDCGVEKATAALSTVDAAPTTAVLGPATGRLGPELLQVPVAGLDDVAGNVVAATRHVGLAPPDRPFRGHLTVARARPRRGVDLRSFCGVALAGEWAVEEITLVASRLHPQGARYEVVHRHPLA